jgi:hypothetical protein
LRTHALVRSTPGWLVVTTCPIVTHHSPESDAIRHRGDGTKPSFPPNGVDGSALLALASGPRVSRVPDLVRNPESASTSLAARPGVSGVTNLVPNLDLLTSKELFPYECDREGNARLTGVGVESFGLRPLAVVEEDNIAIEIA